MKKTKFLFAIILLAVLLTNCTNKSDEYIDPRGTDFAGSESCIQCHKTQHDAVSHSSHFSASSPALKENILGHFQNGSNTFVYDKNTKLVMEERNDSLYQVLYKNGKEIKAYPFEILFGTKHAQTSAYWKNHYAYELPISYYNAINNWATSPGYSATTTNFDRKVEKECFGCHSSNIASRYVTTSSDSVNFMSKDPENFMNKNTLVYGIDCERCHGPSKKHIQTHLKFPNLKKGQNIVAFGNLTRQQKLDACALCHSGNDQMKVKSRFLYKPGEKISDYFVSLHGTRDSLNYDVHGNQLGLLSQSKCFKKSQTMDCISCHNPHQNASKSIVTYSKICISCHQDSKHSLTTLKTISKSMLANNCIECHMPKQDSKAIIFQQSNSKTISSYSLRTHKIAVYPSPSHKTQ
jgi:predicted CXXCH cytochrome family protein